MKTAVIGSRNLQVENIGDYLPPGTTEIISGGARGIDSCAAKYAKKAGLILTEFLPNYDEFGRRAPLLRNLDIIDAADSVVAFWDGKSGGTRFVIKRCREIGKDIKIVMMADKDDPQLSLEEIL